MAVIKDAKIALCLTMERNKEATLVYRMRVTTVTKMDIKWRLPAWTDNDYGKR